MSHLWFERVSTAFLGLPRCRIYQLQCGLFNGDAIPTRLDHIKILPSSSRNQNNYYSLAQVMYGQVICTKLVSHSPSTPTVSSHPPRNPGLPLVSYCLATTPPCRVQKTAINLCHSYRWRSITRTRFELTDRFWNIVKCKLFTRSGFPEIAKPSREKPLAERRL